MDIEPPPNDRATFATYHRGRRTSEAIAAVAVGVAIAYSFTRWKPFRVEISGSSMSPTLVAGDWALAVKPGRLRRWDVVVIEHPRRSGLEMVKRIVALPGELSPDGSMLRPGEWWVEGDSPAESTDSRQFGPVRTEHVQATIRLVYWPASRRRLI
jgi:signal peptidase I